MSLISKSFIHSNDDPTSEWKKLVAEAAYYIAKKRQFSPGSEIEDWLAAEAQVEAGIAQRRLANSESP